MPSTIEAIKAIKTELGERLVILAHHYQRAEIVDLGDFKGDSFELARAAAGVDAELIVFCGVHFMAEAAAILARDDQRVFMPEHRAGCPMADMTDPTDLALAFERISAATGLACLLPLTYMNSTAAVKAFCGARGGAVCTSSNAPAAFEWARTRGERILFVPDEFLGRNTANRLGLEPVVVYDPHIPDGGLTDDQLRKAKVIVWKGYCHVHTLFRPEHVVAARRRHPGARVIVHPECTPDVVAAADGDGSTRFIVDFVSDAGPGSTTVIGTEISLVKRMARDWPDRAILPLETSLCPNMYNTTPQKLLRLLETFESAQEVRLAPDTRDNARLALERMLSLP